MDEEKPKKRKMIPVKVIKAKADSALVEFTANGLLLRAYIPTAEVEGEKAAEVVLMAGIPYGIDWEEVQLSLSSIELANALRRNDIWTCEDAMNNPMKVIAALQAAYKIDLAQLIKFAREHK